MALAEIVQAERGRQQYDQNQRTLLAVSARKTSYVFHDSKTTLPKLNCLLMKVQGLSVQSETLLSAQSGRQPKDPA